MTNDILNFYATAQEREFARKFMFEVMELGPLDEKDRIYIKTAKLPGRTISNHNVQHMGVKFNLPGSVVYDGSDAWEVQFLCDEAHNIRRKILAWQDEIFSIQYSGLKYGTPRQMTAKFRLLQKDRKAEHDHYTMIGIYPTKVGEIEYTVADEGDVQEFSVTFAYQFWLDDKAPEKLKTDYSQNVRAGS